MRKLLLISFAFLAACHSPFEYQTGLFLTTDRVDGYSSEPPEDVSSQFVGWYFSKSDGVCKTLYLRAGVKPFAGNKDLPKSKDECNTKCGKSINNVIFEQVLNIIPL